MLIYIYYFVHYISNNFSITESLYFLITFIQVPTPTSGNHKSNLFFYELFFYLFLKYEWQEYTEELYKKDLHDPDNHDGVITHPEIDIVECKVKWALGSIIMNKASRCDGILSYLKS